MREVVARRAVVAATLVVIGRGGATGARCRHEQELTTSETRNKSRFQIWGKKTPNLAASLLLS